MMKNVSSFVCKGILGILLCVLAFWLGGCRQMGESKTEESVRHQRNTSIKQQELSDDVDKALLMDKPSKLTEMKMR